MDDAFTLLRRATGLLPRDARIGIGATVDDVRDFQHRREWGFVLDLLMEFGDEHPVPVAFWSLLETAARQMMLERAAQWCGWREGEVRHGTFRAVLSLPSAREGRRRTAFAGQGQLRPVWDIGRVTADGGREMYIAAVWVEGAERLGPGESAPVRLAPLSPDRWRHLTPGTVITMHEGRPVAGTATILQVVAPLEKQVRSAEEEG
ncbi:hypothetical protein [Streptomyces griseomycini]|uniref:Uncharacterized protein n=1 Tax=Streptomyces griseomycini TaxID=66895 RepID=A0A7W7LUY3_9ACTN|nr:hypothetical protein [Streptomyces griseomycini]MBB4896206.1 hypothetical protein [Streptomyces griseomycini]GGP82725.1 hypothetical protein GCM10010266_00560 [Streptomyces griseomycini]GGR03983.1 hypothetical protein GCM10015536_06410 [Streptomyces griseomycini]